MKLSDLGEVNRGRSRFRPRYAEHLYGGPYPFVQTGDIRQSGGRITSHTQTYSEAGLAQSRLWPAGTMCITIAANIAETAILTYPACFPDSVVGFIADDTKCSVQFVEYMFRFLRRQIQHEATGSVQDNINLATLERLTFPLPPLDIQYRISHVLGTLDDKIELNRRMNRTLEGMAAAIFKSWFIDFDPVLAKSEGRDPNLPADIAALFPDAFEDSELGMIPNGWKPGKLADIADNPRRTVRPSDVPSTTPYIGLQHMPRCCIALDAWGHADEVDSGKSQFKEGEILFGKLRPYFHKVGIAPVNGVCSTDILVIVPKSAEWHSFVLSLVSSKAFVDHTDSHSAGTKMPRTNWKDMGRYPLAIPPESLVKALQYHVATFHQRIGLSVRQNRRLAGLRDTLLPKLLSGEVELLAAEQRFKEMSK